MTKDKIKIGLLQGNGKDLVGGGSIQLEYNLWANSQEDIELTNLLYTDDVTKTTEFHKELEVVGRKLHNVQFFNELNSNSFLEELFTRFDKLIILTYPFSSKTPLENQQNIASMYEKLLKERQKRHLWTGVICYDYKKEVVLDNLGAKYPQLYKLVDVIWVNNDKNPLIDFLNKIGSKAKRLIECPQFMNDIKLEWVNHKEKAQSQLYYHGRSLDWKGWKEIIPLKSELAKEGLEVNLAFNGISETPPTDLPFTFDKEYNSLYEKGFSKEIVNELEFHGYYSPRNAYDLTSKAMFGVYFTNLDPRQNFLPEYTFIDFIRSGTVLIVPDWYFDGQLHPLKVDYKLIDKSPEEVGMLTWNPYNDETTKELARKIKELQGNEDLYNEYREKAFNYLIESHGADNVIRKFINY